MLFSHNELTTFLSTQNDPSCHNARFLGSKYHKNNFAAGALPRTPLGKLTSWRFVEEGKWKEGENNGKGGTIEKGLQCPEFLTWKVGNPSEITQCNGHYAVQGDSRSHSKGHNT